MAQLLEAGVVGEAEKKKPSVKTMAEMYDEILSSAQGPSNSILDMYNQIIPSRQPAVGRAPGAPPSPLAPSDDEARAAAMTAAPPIRPVILSSERTEQERPGFLDTLASAGKFAGKAGLAALSVPFARVGALSGAITDTMGAVREGKSIGEIAKAPFSGAWRGVKETIAAPFKGEMGPTMSDALKAISPSMGERPAFAPSEIPKTGGGKLTFPSLPAMLLEILKFPSSALRQEGEPRGLLGRTNPNLLERGIEAVEGLSAAQVAGAILDFRLAGVPGINIGRLKTVLKPTTMVDVEATRKLAAELAAANQVKAADKLTEMLKSAYGGAIPLGMPTPSKLQTAVAKAFKMKVEDVQVLPQPEFSAKVSEVAEKILDKKYRRTVAGKEFMAAIKAGEVPTQPSASAAAMEETLLQKFSAGEVLSTLKGAQEERVPAGLVEGIKESIKARNKQLGVKMSSKKVEEMAERTAATTPVREGTVLYRSPFVEITKAGEEIPHFSEFTPKKGSQIRSVPIPSVTYTQDLPETSRYGVELFGVEAFPKFQKALADTILKPARDSIQSTGFYQKLDKMFNRSYIPPGAPKSAGKIPEVLDQVMNDENRTARLLGVRLEKAAALTGGINPEERKLLGHMLDLGLPAEAEANLAQSGVLLADGLAAFRKQSEEIVQALSGTSIPVSPAVLDKLTPARIQQLIPLFKEFKTTLADVGSIERQLNMIDNILENYFTHLYEFDSKAAEWSKAFLDRMRATKEAASRLNMTHPFRTRTGPATLIEAAQANLEAAREGAKAPYRFKQGADDVFNVFAIRMDAHYRATRHYKSVLELSRKYPELVSLTPQLGMEKVNIPGVSEVFPKNTQIYIHPGAAEKLAYEMIGPLANSNNQIAALIGYPLTWLKGINNAWKSLATSWNFPSFQLRNEADNWLVKNFMADVGIQSAPVAAAVQAGVEGMVAFPKGLQIRDFLWNPAKSVWEFAPGQTVKVKELTNQQIGDLVGRLGITGTGQFGSFGDMAQNVVQTATPSSKVHKYLRLFRESGVVTEDNAKIAHWLTKAAESGDAHVAARSVDKFLFNYFQITPFEREIIRPFMPFYTFWRKNIPLMLELYFTSPQKFGQLQAAKAAIEKPAFEAAEKSRGQRVPKIPTEMLPEFMQPEFSIQTPGRVAGERDVISPGLSVGDLTKILRPGQSLGDAAGPIPQVLAALLGGRGRTSYSAVPSGLASTAIGLPGIQQVMGAEKVAGGYIAPTSRLEAVSSLLPGFPKKVQQSFSQPSLQFPEEPYPRRAFESTYVRPFKRTFDLNQLIQSALSKRGAQLGEKVRAASTVQKAKEEAARAALRQQGR